MSVNDASRMVMDNSRKMFKVMALLTNDSGGIIYNGTGHLYAILT
jgi:hypothetical protein